MSNQSTNNNSRLLAIGAAVLVIGVILVLLVLSQGDDPQAEPSPTAAASEVAATQQDTTAALEQPTEPLTAAQMAVARLPQPLEVPEGHEALAVRVNYIRGVASVPTAGDHVKIYRLANDVTSRSTVVLQDAEVLGLIGPLPQTNSGELTFLLAVQPTQVGQLMELSNAFEAPEGSADPVSERHENELWFTLLPSPDEEPSDDASASDDQ